ncbi:MAG: PAS domain-containing sensor histidine kinase [Gemmatimonas sp.]
MGPLSDELLARIVALAADAIICVNAQQSITFFNDGASRIFGYSSDEIMGQPLSVLIPAHLRRTHSAHIDAFGHSPVPARQMGDRSPISGVRKNGEEFPAEAAIAKMIGPDGPIYSVVLRDVTHQRHAYEMSRKLLSDTEAAVQARDEVLGLVSHDLRNPVNAVKMLAAAILRASPANSGETIPPIITEHASVMLQAANQMDALIQDLLDVTRIESGRMILSQLPVPLADVVQQTVSTLAPLAEDRGVVVRAELSSSLPLLDADPDRLVQLLANLVSNAIKFSNSGGTVRITASLDASAADQSSASPAMNATPDTAAQFVSISVIDEGAGIAAHELPMVFDRFWQSKRTNRSGAGLGLAIARGIVRAHGGDIAIESALNKGTTVLFTLPVAAASHPAP